MLERYNQELRRRTRVIRIFPNTASCLRLITAMAMEEAAEWAAQGTYLDMKELEQWDARATPAQPATTS
jgi:transposase-like protein